MLPANKCICVSSDTFFGVFMECSLSTCTECVKFPSLDSFMCVDKPKTGAAQLISVWCDVILDKTIDQKDCGLWVGD